MLYPPPDLGESHRRGLLYRGHILVIEPSSATVRLRDRVLALLTSALPSLARFSDPSQLPDFHTTAARAKAAVGADSTASSLVSELLTGLGCNPARTYRHRLFLRTVPPVGHLGATPPYHAAPHRDTWLSAPASQINWWMPVSQICEESCLVFYPGAWGNFVANDSHTFDYAAYKARFARVHRAATPQAPGPGQAISHPRATEAMRASAGVRITCAPGALILFSAAHLHASVPNTSGEVRVSLDFRTCDIEDVASASGPATADASCTGSSLVDFRRLADGAPWPHGH